MKPMYEAPLRPTWARLKEDAESAGKLPEMFRYGPRVGFLCAACCCVSYHPEDLARRYCARCATFHAVEAGITVRAFDEVWDGDLGQLLFRRYERTVNLSGYGLDLRVIGLEPQLLGAARIWVARPEELESGLPGLDDVFDYDREAARDYKALKAFLSWDPRAEIEPAGWSRHVATQRRRPGGDPAREVVRA